MPGFTEDELRRILDNYSIGSVERLGPVAKDDETSLGQTVYTSQGAYFVKRFNDWDASHANGLAVMHDDESIPTPPLHTTEDGDLHTGGDTPVAVFDHVDLNSDWHEFTESQIRSYAEALARLHSEVEPDNLEPTRDDYDELGSMQGLLDDLLRASLIEYDELLAELDGLHDVDIPSDQYQAACHGEWNSGHVTFNGDDLAYAYDFEITTDYAYLDWAGATVACYTADGKNLKNDLLQAFLTAYNQVRPLTPWEKNHIHQALIYGAAKYAVFTLIDKATGKNPARQHHIQRIKTALNLDGIDML